MNFKKSVERIKSNIILCIVKRTFTVLMLMSSAKKILHQNPAAFDDSFLAIS